MCCSHSTSVVSFDVMVPFSMSWREPRTRLYTNGSMSSRNFASATGPQWAAGAPPAARERAAVSTSRLATPPLSSFTRNFAHFDVHVRHEEPHSLTHSHSHTTSSRHRRTVGAGRTSTIKQGTPVLVHTRCSTAPPGGDACPLHSTICSPSIDPVPAPVPPPVPAPVPVPVPVPVSVHVNVCVPPCLRGCVETRTR